MRLHRATGSLVALLVAASLSLTACGGDDSGGTSTSAGSPEGPGSSETTDSQPTDSDTAPAPSDVNFGDCSAITVEEMAAVLGGDPGVAEVPPASTNECNYTLSDPELPSLFLEQFTTADFADGWQGAVEHIASTALGALDGTPESASGIGDGAEIVVNTTPSTTLPSAIGLVLLGDTIVRATVLDPSGLDTSARSELTSNVLQLVASKG